MKTDQARVDEAIRKGAECLSGAESTGWTLVGVRNCDELLLLTLLPAGLPESHPRVQGLLKAVLEAPLDNVYKVATQAMALEDLDRLKYQSRIWQCAQYLVDSQCASGQWSYGELLNIGMPPDAGTAVSTGPKGGVRDFGSPDGAAPRSKPNTRRDPNRARNYPISHLRCLRVRRHTRWHHGQPSCQRGNPQRGQRHRPAHRLQRRFVLPRRL